MKSSSSSLATLALAFRPAPSSSPERIRSATQQSQPGSTAAPSPLEVGGYGYSSRRRTEKEKQHRWIETRKNKNVALKRANSKQEEALRDRFCAWVVYCGQCRLTNTKFVIFNQKLTMYTRGNQTARDVRACGTGKSRFESSSLGERERETTVSGSEKCMREFRSHRQKFMENICML